MTDQDRYAEANAAEEPIEEEPVVEGSMFDPTNQAAWVKKHQNLLTSNAGILNALIQDLAKKGAVVPDIVILNNRIEHLISQVFPPFPEGEEHAMDGSEAPTNPDRLVFELRWVDRMTAIMRDANRQALAQGQDQIFVPQGPIDLSKVGNPQGKKS